MNGRVQRHLGSCGPRFRRGVAATVATSPHTSLPSRGAWPRGLAPGPFWGCPRGLPLAAHFHGNTWAFPSPRRIQLRAPPSSDAQVPDPEAALAFPLVFAPTPDLPVRLVASVRTPRLFYIPSHLLMAAAPSEQGGTFRRREWTTASFQHFLRPSRSPSSPGGRGLPGPLPDLLPDHALALLPQECPSHPALAVQKPWRLSPPCRA